MPSSIMQTLLDFFGGQKLVSGDQLQRLASATVGSQNKIVAKVGGGQSGATRLPYAVNEVLTVATAADSVMLPPAIPGNRVTVINASANSMQVFGDPANQSNGGTGDVIAVQGSNAFAATGTGVAHASGITTTYACATLGQWRRMSVA